jgi:hypothetical protein
MRRTEEDYQEAYKEFLQVKEIYQKTLEEWSASEAQVNVKYSKLYNSLTNVLENQGRKAVEEAVKNTAESLSEMSCEVNILAMDHLCLA